MSHWYLTRRDGVTRFFTVDDADDDIVSAHKWNLRRRTTRREVYFVARSRPDHTCEVLARRLLNAPAGLEVDHIDGDPLNNCRSNLRLVPHTINCTNRKNTQINNTSGMPGVYRRKNRWVAYAHRNGTQAFVGSFLTPEAAVEARFKYLKEL